MGIETDAVVTNEFELSMEELAEISGGSDDDTMPSLPVKSKYAIKDYSSECWVNAGEFCFNCTAQTHEITKMGDTYLIRVKCLAFGHTNIWGGMRLK